MTDKMLTDLQLAKIWDDIVAGAKSQKSLEASIDNMTADEAKKFLDDLETNKGTMADDDYQALKKKAEDKVNGVKEPIIDPDKNKPDWVGTYKGQPVELPGVKTKQITFVKQSVEQTEKMQAAFKPLRKKFLKELAGDPNMAQKFKEAGLLPDEVEAAMKAMKDGDLPKGYEVHHKHKTIARGFNRVFWYEDTKRKFVKM